MINIVLGRFIKTGNITQLWMLITYHMSVVGKYLSTVCRKCYFRLWYALGKITIEVVSNKNHCKTLKSMLYKTAGIVWEGNLSLCQFVMYPPHILNILYNRREKKHEWFFSAYCLDVSVVCLRQAMLCEMVATKIKYRTNHLYIRAYKKESTHAETDIDY